LELIILKAMAGKCPAAKINAVMAIEIKSLSIASTY
jgi:hypothetical protein